jgi:predicted nucleic acid-binding protein
MSVIINNTVLSNLALISELRLLRDIFGKVYLTPEVNQEVENGIKAGYSFQLHTRQAINNQQWLFLTQLDNTEFELFAELTKMIHIGEASCLAIAEKRGWLFLTDDFEAREYAKKFNVIVSGTIGVLRASVYKNLITENQGEDFLNVMIKNGYRSPIKRLMDIL